MILKENLLEVIQSQKNDIEQEKELINRNLLSGINLQTNHAIIISGIRRSGKSTLLRILMKQTDVYHYFNFEDSRVATFELSDFEKLFDLQNALNPNCNNFFFDEIQNIEGWERFVRTLLDRNKKVFITGSNASLLSYELGTKLTGRHLRYELFPFSYTETLQFMNLEANENSFNDYLSGGGFPEFLTTNDIKVLQDLFQDILYRDIFVRHSVRNTKIVKNLALYLISNIGKEFSYNNLKKHFELGSVNSVISFIEYFEDSYLCFSVPKFDYSFTKQINNPKKIYGIDTGLIKSNTVSLSNDIGRMLENIVFLELKRKGYELFYFKEKYECDFVAKQNDKSLEVFQVCYNLNEDNKAREFNGMVEALHKLNLPGGIILTFNQEDFFEIDGKRIDIIPAWKWMVK